MLIAQTLQRGLAKMEHVQGHSGNAGNDGADRMAVWAKVGGRGEDEGEAMIRMRASTRMHVICCMLYVVCCMLYVVCCSLRVVCCVLLFLLVIVACCRLSL